MKILKAWWHESCTVCVSLSQDYGGVAPLTVESEYPVASYSVERAPVRLFAKYCAYYMEGGFVHFVLDAGNFDNVSLDNAEYYLCGSFNGWGAAAGDPAWKMGPGRTASELELKVDKSLVRLSHGGALFKFATADGRWLDPRADCPNAERDAEGNLNFRLNSKCTGRNLFFIRFCDLPDIRTKIFVRLDSSRCPVNVSEFLHQIYSHKRLGAYDAGGVTEFSIFAPRAQLAAVAWSSPDKKKTKHILTASTSDGAVWTARAGGDLRGCRYCWHILGVNIDAGTDFNSKFPIADPYANAMLSSEGPSIVLYDEDLPKPRCAHTPPPWCDIVVMEVHVRDLLAKAEAHISPDERGGFSGLAKWLSSPDCYIRRAGVNCVELQPIHEFTALKKSDYEWGYMPVNWFSPSSSYASNPSEASQVREFAELVEAFHKAGISVILDVVYNHFGDPNFLLKIDKEYYFEMSPDGRLVNYSGCGNDFRARSPMALRMIVDSLKRMVVNYGVDGFRFDLAELIGVEALREIEVELKKVKPSVILIAEPWSFRGHIARQLRDTGFSSWNDGFREYAFGFVGGGGDFEGFKYFMRGSLGGVAKWPAQTVNYVESHDDMCLFDRLCGDRWQFPSIDDVRKFKMAYAMTLVAPGIPMLAEGFDLLRTKGGKNNTYKDGEANALDYRRGESFTGERAWLRAFVRFRLSGLARALRLNCAPRESYFRFFSDSGAKAYGALFNADSSADCRRVLAAFNPSKDFARLDVGDMGGFIQIADIDRFDVRGLEDCAPISSGALEMPPLSFALFLSER